MVIYIGTSTHGFNRIFNHNIIDKIEEVQPLDSILVWVFSDSFSAEMEELKLILEYNPKYNKVKDVRHLFGCLLSKKRGTHKSYK